MPLDKLIQAIHRINPKGRSLNANVRLLAPELNHCKTEAYTVRDMFASVQPVFLSYGIEVTQSGFSNAYYNLKTKAHPTDYVGSNAPSPADQLIDRMVDLKGLIRANPRSGRPVNRYISLFADAISLALQQGYSYENISCEFGRDDEMMRHVMDRKRLSMVMRYRGVDVKVEPLPLPDYRLENLKWHEFVYILNTFPINERSNWNYLQWLSPVLFALVAQGYTLPRLHQAVQSFNPNREIKTEQFVSQMSALKVKYKGIWGKVSKWSVC